MLNMLNERQDLYAFLNVLYSLLQPLPQMVMIYYIMNKLNGQKKIVIVNRRKNRSNIP